MKADIRQRLLASTLLFGALAYAGPAVAQNAPPPAPLPQNPTEADGSRTDSEAVGAQVPVESGVEPTSAEQPTGDIVVTGSRISRPDLEASSPVTVITGEALEISGTNSVEEYIRDIPQAVAAIGDNTNNGNPGVATVDLRNLGEERTLVLVDGKRFIPVRLQPDRRSQHDPGFAGGACRRPDGRRLVGVRFGRHRGRGQLHPAQGLLGLRS